MVTISAVGLGVSDTNYAGTSGKLRFGVRQGGTSCETARETISKPQRRRNYIKYRSSRNFGSCYNTKFNSRESIQFRVLSDSGDDSYIDSAGVMLDGVWRVWKGDRVKVNKHWAGNSWRTITGTWDFNFISVFLRQSAIVFFFLKEQFFDPIEASMRLVKLIREVKHFQFVETKTQKLQKDIFLIINRL